MKNYQKYDDDKLIKLLAEAYPANNDAFNVLYYRYSEKVKAYCLFKSESNVAAEEIFQETWIKFFNAASNGDLNAKLPAYLFKISRNLSIDRYRSNKRKIVYNLSDIDFEQIADPVNINSTLDKKELLSCITIAVNQLPDSMKEVFLLKWFAGLDYNEIADVTGLSKDCIRQRACRAMSEITNILQPVINEIKR